MSFIERNQRDPRKLTEKKHPKRKPGIKGNVWEAIKNMHIATEAAGRRLERQRNSGINPHTQQEEPKVVIQDGFLKGLGFYDEK